MGHKTNDLKIISISLLILTVSLFILCIKLFSNQTSNRRYPIINSQNILLLGGANIVPTSKLHSHKAQIDEWAKHGANFGRIWTILPWQSVDALFPWKRTGPGVANDGGAKFDLNQWEPKYWQAIKQAIHYAGQRGVILQYMIFDEVGLEKSKIKWFNHPFNPNNNVNALTLPSGDADARRAFYDLNNSRLLKHQENYVTKVINEVSEYPNIHFEVANETTAPWKWQKHFIDHIDQRCDNLIANNPFRHELENLQYPSVDIINVHNLTPGQANKWFVTRFKYNKILKYDEQYIGPQSELSIRKIAWFTLTGGGHLNWDESGNRPYVPKATAAINYFLSLVAPDFAHMKPRNDVVFEGTATVLAAIGKEYIIYSAEDEDLTLRLPKGEYKILFYDPASQMAINQLRLVSKYHEVFSKPDELKKPLKSSLKSFLKRLRDRNLKNQSNPDWCLYLKSTN